MRGDVLLYENPYRRRNKRRRRNPTGAMALPKPISKWLPVSVQEIVAGAGGLFASTMVPSAIYPDPQTNMQKLAKFGVALGSAIGASMLAGTLRGGARKAALIGGVSGATYIGISMITNKFQIGGRKLLGNKGVKRLGESRGGPATSDEKGILTSVT